MFRHEQMLLLNDSDTERDSEGATELEAYGNDAIKRLTKKFAVSLQVMDVNTRLAGKSYSEMWDWMTTYRSDTMDPAHFYDLLCLVVHVLVRTWMLDTSCCERGFSIMNLLRSPVRNRLSRSCAVRCAVR